MRVLYIPIPEMIQPWYDDFTSVIGDRHKVTVRDLARPFEEQVKGIDVIVEVGGSRQTRQMVDAAAAARVKLWQIAAVGLDRLGAGIAYFHEKRVPLSHTPGIYSGVSLAEHALFLMLCFAKNFAASQKNLRARVLCFPVNDDLCGKTLGVIGLGGSGRELAKRAKALGMRVMAIVKSLPPPPMSPELHLDFVGGPAQLDQVLGEADYLSLHVPLTPQTRHLIGPRAFHLMKPSAVIINVARGEIIDEAALVEALQSGRIRGAGLDVFTVEPADPSHPLLQMDNVVATPHIAGVTNATSRRRAEALVENIERLAKGLAPLHLVKRE